MKPLLENWVKQLEEELADYKSSFEVKDELTPEVWQNNQLKAEVLGVLRDISKDFFDGLELGQIDIKDIILTGSLANYNWSEYSDIDFDILVMGYEVEIYVQDINEPHKASGQYSIMNDSWNVEPSKVNPVIDWNSISLKYESFRDQIARIAEIHDDGHYEQANTMAIRLQDRLRKFRKSGLETGGEFSVENLTFKVLRRSGAIGELIDTKHRSYDATMSLDSPLPE